MTGQRPPRTRRVRGLAAIATLLLTTGLVLVQPADAVAADFVVTSAADSGAGSLRAAVQAANATAAADTITFAPTVTRIDLRRTIAITAPLHISGPGSGVLTIGRAVRTTFAQFTIDTSGDVTVSGATVTGITGGRGRGIEVENVDDVRLDDVRLTGQTAPDEEGGAAIGIWEVTGGVALNQVEVLRNTATWSTGVDLESSDSPYVTITDSVFEENVAQWGEGGGVYALTAGVVTITGSRFTRNTSVQSADPDAYGDPSGGAVFVRSAAELVVGGSQFTGNQAGTFGGAIAVDELLGGTTIRDSVFTGNTSGLSGGALNISDHSAGSFVVGTSTFDGNTSSGGDGGAIDVESALSVLVEASKFVGNRAPDPVEGDGGAVYVDTATEGIRVVESSFTGNAAGFDGGGLMLSGVEGATLVERSTFSGNSFGSGGGASIGGFGVENDLTIVNSTLVEPGSAITMNPGPFGGSGTVRLHDATVQAPGAAVLDAAYALELRETAVDSLGAAVGVVPGTLAIAWSALTATPVPADYGTYVDGGGNRVGLADLQLSALADNGGPTLTMLPAMTSPLIDGGNPVIVDPPATDQRGLPRLSGRAIDIGAVEVQQPLPPDPAHSTLTVAPAGPLTADGSDAFTASVVVRNRDDEAVPDAIVTFDVADEVTPTATQCVTAADGRCSIALTSVTAGSYALAALLDGQQVDGSPATLGFVAGAASASRSTIEASPNSIAADGTDAALITVRLLDAHGNPLTASGGTVTLTTTLGTLSAVIDHRDGSYTAKLTATKTGRAVLGFAIDGETGSATAEVQTLEWLPATGALLVGTLLAGIGLLLIGALVRIRRIRA